jgi:epoxide hydrolase 4
MDGALTSMLNWYRALPPTPSPAESPVQPPIRAIWGDRDAALNADLAGLALQRCRRGSSPERRCQSTS